MSSKLENVGLFAILAPIVTLFIFGASFLGWFANGFVAAHLWAWFAVPLGMRQFGWTTFAAVFMAKSLFGAPKTTSDTDKEESGAAIASKLIIGLAWPWFVLLMGWWIK